MKYFLVSLVVLFTISFGVFADDNASLKDLYEEGKSLLDQSKLDESRLIFSKLNQLNLSADDTLTFWILDHLSDTHYFEGDIDASTYWYLEELRTYENCMGDRSAEVGKMHYWIGENFREKGDLKQAEKHFRFALDIFETEPPSSLEYAAFLNNCIDFYDQIQDSSQALKLFDEGVDVPENKEFNELSIDRKHNLALTLASFEPERALGMLEQCTQQYRKLGLIKASTQTTNNIISILVDQGKSEAALHKLHQMKDTTVQFQILSTKLLIESGKLDSATISLNFIREQMSLSEKEQLISKQLNASLTNAYGQDEKQKLVVAFHMRCDLIEDILVQQQGLLGLIDFEKWFLNLNELSALTFTDFQEIDQQNLATTYEYDRVLRLFETLKKRRQKWIEKGISYKEDDDLATKLTAQKNGHNWPNYLKQLKDLKVTEIQAKIKSNEAIIHLLEEGEIMRLLVVKKENVMFHTIKLNDKKDSTKSINGDNSGNYVCNQILSLIDLKQLSNLVIIPDEESIALPFEAYKPSDKFLIESHQVRFVTSLLKSQQKKKPITENSTYIGFAPSIPEDNQEISFEEMLTGATYFSKSLLKAGKDVSETVFKNAVGNFDIVHLVTHSKPGSLHLGSDKQNDGQLRHGEMRNIKLSTRLVILSSCNTGLGETDPGNGLKSTAQDFCEAGVPEVLFTAFEIPDKQSDQIISDFFSKLSKEQDVASALRSAKLSFLKQADYNLKNPYYWVGPRVIERDWIVEESQGPVKSEFTWYYFLLFIVIIYLLRTESYFRGK